MNGSSKYSPFEKELREVQANDLVALTRVEEGWYVEYKREVPQSGSIAKSVAAFANTYGGFLFYGIAEKSKEEPVAGAFPGVDVAELDAVQNRIRQSIASHLSPVPHFDVKVVIGPSAEIELAEGRAIVCIEVPWSPRAPHIHKAGLIYRRVGDASEPKPENDRHILDELFKRSEKRIDQARIWFEDDPVFSDSEQASPYLRLMFRADAWGEDKRWMSQPFAELRSLLNKDGITPFDTVCPTARGVMGRQAHGNDPAGLPLTIYVDRDLTADALIPIPLLTVEDLKHLPSLMEGYDNAHRFSKILTEKGFKRVDVLDLNHLYLVLSGVFKAYHNFVTESGLGTSYNCLPKPLNFGRFVPFIDVSTLMDAYEEAGVPVVMKPSAVQINAHHPDRYLVLDAIFEEPEVLPHYVNASVVLHFFAESIGARLDLLDEGKGVGASIAALIDAGERSQEAQRLRNQRGTRAG